MWTASNKVGKGFPNSHFERARSDLIMATSGGGGDNDRSSFNRPTLPSLPPLDVGFACSFIAPPREIATECPICLHILRDPEQATCCGSIYCKTCIERVAINKKPCPICRNPEFSIFPDRSLRNLLYSFKVWCSHKDRGCDWSGELIDLNNHLNLNSNIEHRFVGCGFIELLCSTCNEIYPRQELERHESKHCLKRRYRCEYCSDFEGVFEDVVKAHWPKCLYRSVPCSNGCGLYPLQKNLEHHMKKECELRTKDEQNIEQAQAMVSTSENELRRRIEISVEAKFRNVLSGILKSTAQENDKKLDELREEIHSLKVCQAESRTLKQELELLKFKEEENRRSIESLRNHLLIVPVSFKLNCYKKHKVQHNLGWSSPPFYTHPCGYRMCLLVDVGGDKQARGTHVSMFLHLTKGEFDDQLKWPLRMCITVELLQQGEGESRISHDSIIRYHSGTPEESAEKVSDDRRNSKPWGKSKFISHEELESGGFVCQDSLKFGISQVDLLT